MKMNNKGFSFVEIIVVVSIVTILSLAGVIGFQAVSGKPANQCIVSLKNSLLSARSTSMGKSSCSLVIYSNNGIHVKETTGLAANEKDTVIAPDTVTLSYSFDGGATYTVIDATGLTVTFDRSSGGLGTGFTSDVIFKATKSNKSYCIKIYRLTGKVDIIDVP